MLRNFFPKGDEIIYFAISFVLVFVSVKFGQYLYYSWLTTPTILWPAAGIIIAILWIKGYRYSGPIFLALVISAFTSPGNNFFPFVIITPVAQLLSGLTAVYLLRKYQFEDNFSTLKIMVTFLAVCAISSAVAPTITTFLMFLYGKLTIPIYYTWLRSWAGYLLSTITLFPVIVSWYKNRPVYLMNRVRFIEMFVLSIFLLVSVYIIFWLHLDKETLFLFFAAYFIAVFWACLRFSPRVLHLCILVTVVFGISGLFLSPDPDLLLNNRLLASEMLFLLLVPVFYTFSSLVQESKLAMRNLAETKNKIEKESVAKSEFIAVLAHELRNPLAPLKTTLEILEMENVHSDIKKLISSANLEVYTMRRLLDDLLDTTRMIQGKFQLQIEPSNLCNMINHCIDHTMTIYKERNHTIIFDKVCDSVIWLDVDPIRFEQIIVNILNNAAKYTNLGGQVQIDCLVVGKMVEIKISDNGVGIHADNISHIFDSFWQVDRVNSRSGGGIGVGMSLTKQIVEMHYGTIGVESAGLNQGTTFTVNLPLSKTTIVNEPTVAKTSKKITAKNILVVDDNQAAADSMAKLLNLKGHQATVAYLGQVAIETAQSNKPDIIFLDIGLPDIDGYNVAKLLRSLDYPGQLVALSGYSQKEDINKAYAHGFDNYLTKPISIDRVEEYLRTLPQ